MKIPTKSQQPNLTQQSIDTSDGKTESGATRQRQNAAAKPLLKLNKVEPPPQDAELKTREAEQALRVETIKALVKEGKYQVSSRDVAQKMLSDLSKK